jgi:coenzyme PQQ precursor peptide PqqA
VGFEHDSLHRLDIWAVFHKSNLLEIIMAWTTPAATDLRFGFEITMYIANR